MIKNNKYLNDPRVYVLAMSDSRKKQSSCVNLAFVLGISVFQLLAGMVNQDSSRTGWIVFLYLSAADLCLFRCVYILGGGDNYELSAVSAWTYAYQKVTSCGAGDGCDRHCI